MGATNTPNLGLLRIQETWQFADDAFNRFVDDADNKLVGVAHLESPQHWEKWQANTLYAKDDIVRITNGKSHQYYQCISAGTSGVDEPINNVTGSVLTDGTVQWKIMSLSESDIGGGSIQIWLSGWYYKRGDAVIYGTALYRSKIDHTAMSWDTDYSYWQEICASIRMWQPIIYYFVDDTVIANGLIYKCVTAHKSNSVFNSVEESHWEVIGGAGGAGDWATGAIYQEGQLVTVDGILYKANQKHTSGSSFQLDLSKWDIVNANIKGWGQNTYYPADTLINYQGIMYKCILEHTSTGNFYDDRTNWVLFHNPIVDWESNNYYEKGQIAIYNNCIYRCNTSHSTFSNLITLNPTIWQTATNYAVDDAIIENNILYRCKIVHTSTIFLDDITNWEIVKDLNIGVTTWTPNTQYLQTDKVMYGGQEFECTSYNISSTSFLDDISHWSTQTLVVDSFELNQNKWDLLYSNIQEWKPGAYYKEKSIVLYNNVLFRCIVSHKSNVFMSELGNWEQLHKLDAIVRDWQPSTQYWESQLVLNDDILYRSRIDHISSPTKFIADYNKWDIVRASISEWGVSKEYIIGDMVIYNNLLFRCIVNHTAIDFALDINDWELLCGINEWEINTTYKTGAILLYDGVLYKVKTSFTSSNTFDDSNLEKIGGVGGAVVWQPETKYSENQLIIYDKLLYRATNDFVSNTTFDKTNLNQITIGWTAYWQPSTYYTVGETVVQANSIIRCAIAHTSGLSYNTAEAVNWVIIASAQAIITYWTPNTQYTNGNAVIHNDILYICNITHTSSTDFENDMLPGYEKWRTINTSATSGSWVQVTQLGVIAPKIIEIIINNTTAFCTSPVEILKFRLGTQDQMVNEFTFIAGDGQKFTVDGVRADTNEYVIFDGQVRLKTEYIYPMVLDTQTSKGYINVSDEIDLSEFKYGEDLVVR